MSTFTGTKSDSDTCENFVNEALRLVETYAMPLVDAREWVLRHLGGPALREVRESLDSNSTAEDILNELLSVFGDRTLQPQLLEQFHTFI